ncbi:hypothetical protein CRM22_010892 [Opisthorchis felineus]|uniref:UDP-D-xylose:beta-D-glucoside alpha-1,3-D-xylosyltransferase n=1 Tax=Opisthorchis felineus TaxID=147828 RepID=A0A4S2KPW8_OPIFE|nr:hypothetical protein CRM22_010892 [Opisthorchis felineus]
MRREVKCLGVLLICIAASAWIIGKLSWDLEFEYGALYTFEINHKVEPLADAAATSTIHLFLVIPDFKTLEKTETMLKSLLFYQGRLDETFVECTPTLNKPESIKCSDLDLLATASSLTLHVAASDSLGDQTAELFGDFHVEDLTVQLYSLESCLDLISVERNGKASDTVELLKLFAPKILNDEVEKVIILDANVLIVANIGELWDHFDQFNSEQAIGAVCEQGQDCSRSCSTGDGEFPTHGINTGLLLLNLNELRRLEWWNMTGADGQTEESRLTDRGLINRILERNENLYYKLPCQWNVQIIADSGLDCCPFYWIERRPEEDDCVNTEDDDQNYIPMARAIQFNIDRRTELNFFINGYSADEVTLVLSAAQQLQVRYENTYRKFQQLSPGCFG